MSDISKLIVPAYTVSKIDKVRMVLYGPPKCGKTTWIAHNAPKPLIIDVEQGVISLIHDEVVRNTPTYPFYQRNKIHSLLEFLRTKDGDVYETIVIDTLTEWNSKLLDGIIKAANPPRADDNPQIQDYGLAGNVMRRIITDLLEMDKHIIVTAHTQDRKFGETTKTAPSIPPKVATTVEGLFSIIAYMTKTTTRDGVKTKMQFVDTPTLVAGNRLQLPAYVENPTFQTLLDALPNQKRVN